MQNPQLHNSNFSRKKATKVTSAATLPMVEVSCYLNAEVPQAPPLTTTLSLLVLFSPCSSLKLLDQFLLAHFTRFSLAMQFNLENILNGEVVVVDDDDEEEEEEEEDVDPNVASSSLPINRAVYEQDLWNMDELINWGGVPEVIGSIFQSPSQSISSGKKRPSNMSNRCPRPKRMKITHKHVCEIHPALPDSKPASQCFGKFSLSGRYKGARCTRMVSSFVPGQLPVCSQHNSQIIPMMYCEALLECGFPCREMAPWKPHGYRLCAAHWSRGKCFLMEVPYEIRRMIYRYLIPNRKIPARNRLWGQLRADGTAACTAIFRVNKSIHEEVADMFYGLPTFQIDVSNVYWKSGQSNKIFMCNRGEDTTTVNQYALLAYQRQLMLLAHQNRTLLRQIGVNPITQTPLNLQPPLIQPPAILQLAPIANLPPPPTLNPHLPERGVPERANNSFLRPWEPPLSQRYFRRVRSFHIAITFDVPTKSEEARAENERHLLCDSLHRVVELFISDDQHTIRNLDISIMMLGIQVGDAKTKKAVISHAESLLEPFRRLRNVSKPRVVSISIPEPLTPGIFGPMGITMAHNQDRPGIDLIRDLDSRPTFNHPIQSFIEEFCKELASSDPPPESHALKYFAMLANTISEMSEHPYWLVSDLDDMDKWLEIARAAREGNDLKSMKSVYAKMVIKLKEYSSSYKDFMGGSIKKMRSINPFFAAIRDFSEV